jgi:hypothetical protein
METLGNNNQQDSNSKVSLEEKTNIDLIYSYTESYLKLRNESVRSLNTKLAGLIGFSGALLKPFTDLPSCSYCSLLKMGIFILLLVAVLLGLTGLFAQSVGDVAEPTELYEDWYYNTNEECRQFIVGSWQTAIKQITEHGEKKAKYFNYGIICFATAIFLVFICAIFDLAEQNSLQNYIDLGIFT